MNINKKLKIACSIAGLCALVPLASQAQIAYTGNGTGDWGDIANWDGIVSPESATGNYVIADGFTTVAVTGNNLSLNDSVVTVQGSSSGLFGNKQLQNAIVNFQDSSEFLIENGFRNGYDAVINYNSSAISDSTGLQLSVHRAADATRAEATINLNSGGLIFGELFYNEAGGVINLGGGDLNVTSINLSAGMFTGGIDFGSVVGSAFTLLGSTTSTDLDSFITGGFFTIDGLTDAASASWTFDKSITGAGLELTVVAVPEPSTYALLAGCLALGAVMVRRRSA